MPSPFPGMDPYLEGYLWPDLHHDLATQIMVQLNRLIVPRYVARIVVRTVVEQLESSEAVSVSLPDVAVFGGRAPQAPPTSPPGGATVTTAVMPAPVIVPQPLEFEVEIPSVEIRDVAGGTLVTSIEILSPTNKQGIGWDEYQIKRRKVFGAQAHLLEIDLLRRGRRPVETITLPRAQYYVFLTRVHQRDRLEAWPIQLRDPLPTVAVPLRPPDPDVPLDLQSALTTIYDEARYDLSLDYGQPPNPPLSRDDAAWAAEWLRTHEP